MALQFDPDKRKTYAIWYAPMKFRTHGKQWLSSRGHTYVMANSAGAELKYFRNSQINPVYTIVRNLKMQFREVPSMAFANFIAWLKNAFLKKLPTLLSWETGSLSYNWFVSQSCIVKFQSVMIRSVTVTLQPVCIAKQHLLVAAGIE